MPAAATQLGRLGRGGKGCSAAAQKLGELKWSRNRSLQLPSQHDFFIKSSCKGQGTSLSGILRDYVAPQTLTNNKRL